jgi:hypothetical protein
MDTMPETVLYERKEGGMQPLPTLMKIHLTPDLILLKNSSSSQPSQDPPHTISDLAEEFFFISALSGTIPTSNNIWLIDSGANRHMTGYKEHLTELVEKDSRLHVVLGDDARYAVKGTGITSLQLDSGISLHFSDVLFVLGMRRNLVSISALEDKGYKVPFTDGKVLAWHKNSSMDSSNVIGVREDNLYKLTVHLVQALAHDSISLSELWHIRLAHIHYRALPALGKIVTGLPPLRVEHDGVCRGCALGKNAKGTFSSSDNRSKGVLDLIHSDLCGPMTIASLSGYLYYVIFIDDYSRNMWIYFLKSKESEEFLVRFQEFKAQIENLTGRKIKTLRSDNGGAYTSKCFTDFVIEAGIKREYIVPYNPQQNGVAERRNMSILEATKAMIHDQSLPMFLWAEASMTTVYAQNISPFAFASESPRFGTLLWIILSIPTFFPSLWQVQNGSFLRDI